MSSRIRSYLEKIRSGNPINFASFRRALTQELVGESEIDRAFKAVLIGPRSYRVQVQDAERFERIVARFSGQNETTRIGAALSGDSHQVNVSGSCLILRSLQQSHPVVVLMDENGYSCPIAIAPVLLLVENLENFLAFEATLNLLTEWLDVDCSNWQVVFSAGNQISNRLHTDFLQHYKKIFCLFDLDLGGLKAYSSLKNMLPDRELHFVLPDQLEPRLNASHWILSVEEREELLRYRNVTPEVDQLISLMRASRRKLEQETYLAPFG